MSYYCTSIRNWAVTACRCWLCLRGSALLIFEDAVEQLPSGLSRLPKFIICVQLSLSSLLNYCTDIVTESSVGRVFLNELQVIKILLKRAAIDGAIAAAQPEYIKRENVWALSTAFGDAYLIQVSSCIKSKLVD